MTKAWYALRRTLPPWNVDDNLKDLVGFCCENRIDEVIAKVDSEEFSHGLPTVEWVDAYLPTLRRIKHELAQIGVIFSVNPWVTLGQVDRGRNLGLTHPDIDTMVGHDGTQCKACACPLSGGWRRTTRALWRRYASLEPNVIWVEDDIRLLNHQPVAYGCFCSLHMREFSRRVGKDVLREYLVAALLAPGEPHPYRKAWLDLNREIMIDVAGFLERTVHEVSPETKLGLMCSSPTSHAIEGRDWDAFTSALAGGQGLYARPCMFNYAEESPRGLYDAEYYFRATQHCLKPDVKVQTEIENIPFTTYAKSTRFTFLQCALSFVFGADGVTLNLFDHMGSPMSASPEFGKMLRERKPFLDGLARRCYGGKHSGIQLVHAFDGSYHSRLKEPATYSDLSTEGHGWRRVLEPLGFPITFENSNVVALSDQVVRALRPEQIEQALSSGALLDLTALKCLIDMGFGEMVGVSVKREFHKCDEPLAAEEYIDGQFGGSERTYLTLILPDLSGDAPIAEIEPFPQTRVVSRIVDADAKPVYPFLTLYENSLGGHVATYPIDIEYCAGPAFLNPTRKRQIEAVLGWLSAQRTPLIVSGGAYPLPFRIDKAECTIIGAFNLSLDDWPDARFDVHAPDLAPCAIECIDENGEWRSDPLVEWTRYPGGTRMVLGRPLEALSIAVLTLWWTRTARNQ